MDLQTAIKHALSVPVPAPRSAVRDEAFFPDEAGPLNARGLRDNKYASQVTNRTFDNPLNNPVLVTTRELSPSEEAKLPGGSDTYEIQLYIPGTLQPGMDPVRVTLLFAVGTEMIRHGLREFFSQLRESVLILIPGVEPSHTVLGRAWGRGITNAMIDQLFAQAGFPNINWKVQVVACYSTGYRGFNGSILNFSLKPNTLDLTTTRQLVIYDCLYRGDKPVPGTNTKRALELIDSETNNTVRLAVYEVTSGGTPRTGGDTRVQQSALTARFGSRYRLINLKPDTKKLAALIYARMFDAAVKDGYLPLAALPTSLQNLISGLPTRGFIGSTDPTIIPPTTSLKTWASAHAADVSSLQKDLEKLRKDVIAAPRFNLMGWSVPSVGDVLHDGFIPEFGYELLIT